MSALNIEIVAGESTGAECAGCFTTLVKGKPCLHLRIKKVKILLIKAEKNEELCELCGMQLLDDLGRAIRKLRPPVEK